MSSFDRNLRRFFAALLVVTVIMAVLICFGVIQFDAWLAFPIQIAVIGGIWAFFFPRRKREIVWAGRRSLILVAVLLPLCAVGLTLAMSGFSSALDGLTAPSGEAVSRWTMNVHNGQCLVGYNDGPQAPQPMAVCRQGLRAFGRGFAGAWLLFAALGYGAASLTRRGAPP